MEGITDSVERRTGETMGSVRVLVLGCVLENGEMSEYEYEGGEPLTEGQRVALKTLEPIGSESCRMAFKHPVTGGLRYTTEETFNVSGREFIIVWSVREMLVKGEIAPDRRRCPGLDDLLSALDAEGDRLRCVDSLHGSRPSH